MRLLAKITIFNLLLAVAAFAVGGVRVYHKFRYEVERETDFSLVESLDQIVLALKSGATPAELENTLVAITEVDTTGVSDSDKTFSDTLAMHPVLKRLELQRRLIATRRIHDRAYRFVVLNVVIEQSDIARISKNLLQDLFILLGAILLVFNFLISRWLLRPFEGTLDKIRSFNLQTGDLPALPDTSTTEFRQLNSFLNTMMQKARQDYRALKEFSENASHEMQTPLAIAGGKLELLLESNGLSDAQVQLVQDARQALSRLSKLGEALLLLTKIENQEFTPQAPADMSAILQTDVQSFEELAGLKGLRFRSDISPGVRVVIDPVLAHILAGNLLKNAIRHNIEAGWIAVSLDGRALRVSNTGPEPPVPVEQLFQRFQKSRQTDQSLGLGLAIVKKICEVHGFEVQYGFEGGVHTVELRW